MIKPVLQFRCPALLVTLIISSLILSVKADSLEQDRNAIRDHIDKIFKAYIAKDRETVRETHHRQWIGFLLDSRHVIRGIDEYMSTADAYLRDSGRRILDYDMMEIDFHFFGDLAVVPYVARIGVKTSHQSFSLTMRVLDVYRKQGEHWMQVASNTSLHPESEEALRRRPRPVSPLLREEVLSARQAVWEAWFDNDQERLREVIPSETIAINAGEIDWQGRDQILFSARDFSEKGGKLVRLEYPRTEIQVYGDVAILYTTYDLDLKVGGEIRNHAGRGTEVFVRREQGWVNPGWHLDSGD